jgi:hypothetical protein
MSNQKLEMLDKKREETLTNDIMEICHVHCKHPYQAVPPIATAMATIIKACSMQEAAAVAEYLSDATTGMKVRIAETTEEADKILEGVSGSKMGMSFAAGEMPNKDHVDRSLALACKMCKAAGFAEPADVVLASMHIIASVVTEMSNDPDGMKEYIKEGLDKMCDTMKHLRPKAEAAKESH